jgi:DNA-binding transcriptional ArsR family regulator
VDRQTRDSFFLVGDIINHRCSAGGNQVTEFSKEADASGAARWLEVIADPVRLGILRSLSQVGEATAADLASWGQASSQTLRRHLDALVALGVIDEHPPRSDGETPGRPAARFSLPEEMRRSVRSILDPPKSGSGPGPGSMTQAVARPAASATLASTNATAALGPMNGASAR